MVRTVFRRTALAATMAAAAAWCGLAAPATAVGADPAASAPAPGTAVAAPRAKPPIDAFGRLPSVQNLALSADGTRLAYTLDVGDGRYVSVYSLSEQRPLLAYRLGDVKLRDIRWADADRLLLYTSATASIMELSGPRREWMMLQVCDVTKRGCRPLDFRTRDKLTLNTVWGTQFVRRIDGRSVLFTHGIRVESLTKPALFRVDLESLQTKIVEQGDVSSGGWLVGSDGAVAAAIRYSEDARRWTVLAMRDGAWREVAGGQSDVETPRLVGLAPDGDSPIATFLEDGATVWKVLKPADGSWTMPYGDEAARARPLVDELNGRLIGYGDASNVRYRFVDPEFQHRWDSIVKTFGEGARVSLESWSEDFGAVAVRVFRRNVPPEYHVMDWATRHTRPIGAEYAGVDVAGDVRALTYRAADGFEVPSVLTLPPGREPKSLPLVVLPHGGPAARDTPDFDWWAQALASRGYAVLQPNFRGSSLSWRFISAGFGEWGRKMQTDLSDGVRHLASAGTIDPRRVCIVGGSYGGYAALAGAALDTGVYRCAIAVAGVSDPGRFLAWADYARGRGDGRSMRWWQRFMGASGPKDPSLAAISPVQHADAVTIPVQLIHGKDDTVVPFEQSEAMYRALQKLGKPVELVALKHEDHWLSRSETRTQMLQASIAFLEKNNPPD